MRYSGYVYFSGNRKKREKSVERKAFDAEKGQRIGDRTGNAFTGVGQGTVQIEEAVGVV